LKHLAHRKALQSTASSFLHFARQAPFDICKDEVPEKEYHQSHAIIFHYDTACLWLDAWFWAASNTALHPIQLCMHYPFVREFLDLHSVA
jgi:hypothetical protein